MSDKKLYTPKEAAIAVLKKAEELLKKSEHKHIGWDKLHSKLEHEGYSKKSSDKIAGAIKAKVEKSEDMKKDGATAANPTSRIDSGFGAVIMKNESAKEDNQKEESQHKEQKKEEKQEDKQGDHVPKNDHTEKDEAPSDDVREQESPEDNKHEQKEGNNEEWGTAPETYGHLKLAHFIGRMAEKRKAKQPSKEPMQEQDKDFAAKPPMDKSEASLEKSIGDAEVKRRRGESQDILGNKVGKVSAAGHINSAKMHKDWSKDPRASSPSIERSLARDSMKAAKVAHKEKLSSIKAQPKANLTKKEDGKE